MDSGSLYEKFNLDKMPNIILMGEPIGGLIGDLIVSLIVEHPQFDLH